MSVLIFSHHLPPSGYFSSGRRRAGEAPEPDSRCRRNSPPARGGVPRRGEVVGESTNRSWEKTPIGGGRNSFQIHSKPISFGVNLYIVPK